jgi:hypothetical protein
MDRTLNFLNKIKPEPCPVDMVRIGGNKDGAYLIPNDLKGIESCFSPGVNNFKNFEDELTTLYGIKCHMCDFTSDLEKFKTPLIKHMQSFEKKWLDIDEKVDSISLLDWVNKYSKDSRSDLLLQIDIEGAEYRNLTSASTALIKRFRIIAIELHGMKALSSASDGAIEIKNLIDKLFLTHACVHARANNCCGEFIHTSTGLNVPDVMELTYLRRDRLNRQGLPLIPPQIPHPLDIPYNYAHIQPLHLNKYWLPNCKRSLESELKIIRDYISQEAATTRKWMVSYRHLTKGISFVSASDRNLLLQLAAVLNLFKFYVYQQAMRFSQKDVVIDNN